MEKRKFLASTGIRTPDRPARSESLYGLSYPGHSTISSSNNNNNNNNNNKKKKKKKKKYVQVSRRGNCTEFYTEVA